MSKSVKFVIVPSPVRMFRLSNRRISNLTIHVFLLFGTDPTSHDLIVKAVFPSEKVPKGRGG